MANFIIWLEADWAIAEDITVAQGLGKNILKIEFWIESDFIVKCAVWR